MSISKIFNIFVMCIGKVFNLFVMLFSNVVQPFLLFLHLFVMLLVELVDLVLVIIIDASDFPNCFVTCLFYLHGKLIVDLWNLVEVILIQLLYRIQIVRLLGCMSWLKLLDLLLERSVLRDELVLVWIMFLSVMVNLDWCCFNVNLELCSLLLWMLEHALLVYNVLL
jgi:hypothetical protein